MRVPFLNSFELPLSSSGLRSPLRQFVAVVQSEFSLSILSLEIEPVRTCAKLAVSLVAFEGKE